MIRRMSVPLIAALLLAGAVSAQTDSTIFRLLTRDRPTDCPTYILNAKRLIPGYYESGKMDSIDAVLNFLDSACSNCAFEFEPFKKLLAIEANTFNDPLCGIEFIDGILGWRYYYSFPFDDFLMRGMSSRVCEPDASRFESLVQSLATSLSETTDPLSLAHVYCKHIKGDDQYILEHLKSGDYAQTCLGLAYQNRVDSLEQRLKTGVLGHWALGVGVWSPQSAAGQLGNKMEIVGRAGIHKHRYIADLVGAFRFLNSAEPYEVGVNGKAKITEYFSGGYFGFEGGYECIRGNRIAIDLLGGVGWDGFEAFNSDKNYRKTVKTANLNISITPRIFINKTRTRYIGLQGKYNWLKYGTEGGSDLSGNAISVCLLYGNLAHGPTVGQLKHLLYYE